MGVGRCGSVAMTSADCSFGIEDSPSSCAGALVGREMGLLLVSLFFAGGLLLV